MSNKLTRSGRRVLVEPHGLGIVQHPQEDQLRTGRLDLIMKQKTTHGKAKLVGDYQFTRCSMSYVYVHKTSTGKIMCRCESEEDAWRIASLLAIHDLGTTSPSS